MKNKPKIAIWLTCAAILVVLSIATLFTFFGQLKNAAEMRQHTFLTLSSAHELLSSLKDAESGERGFLLTTDEAFLKTYLEVRDTINGQLHILKELTTIPAAQAHLETMTPLIKAKLAHMAQLIELARNKDMPSAVTTLRGAEGKHLMDSIRVSMASFISVEEAAFKKYDAAFQSQMRRLFAIIIFTSLFVLLFALVCVYIIYRNTQQQMKNLVHVETQRLLETQGEMNQQLQQAFLTLRDSEEKLEVTLNSIGDAVIATDANACITLLNPVAQELTGWSQTQALGRPVAEVFNIVNRGTREAAIIPVIETLAHGTVQGLANHTVLIGKDLREFDIADSCAPIRDREGDVIGAVLVFRNVSKEYAVQEELLKSNALVKTILNTVADGIVTFHACSGLLETLNPAVEKLFGYDKNELVGQPFSLVVPAFDQDQCNVCLTHSSANTETLINSSTREVTGHCKNGSTFPLEMTISEMWMGEKRYFTTILRDVSARKRAADALLRASALQHAIFNSANFSSIATDAKGVIQIFNVGAERMLGYAAIDVMDKVTPADISDPQEVILRATTLSDELETTITPGFEALVFKASRGIEDIYELTYIRKDGSRLPAVVSVTALRDAQDAIIGYLLIGTDNTARKQAEEALLKAGALQNAIFNSANFSSIATDAKGVIQIFNVGAERMLGYEAAEVVNKITPADISDAQEVILRATTLSTELETNITPGFEALVFKASRGIEDIYELTYIRKDGSRFPAVVSVTALRDAQETIIGYLLIGTDNTARKHVEAEQKKLDQRLRDQQFYTRSLIESNIDALMTTDPAGIISDVNRQMEALTGCSRDELIGAPFKNYFTDPERAEAGIKQVLRENKVTNYELTARAYDGKETDVSYNATTFYDRERNLQGVFAAARDVTERKRLDKVLAESHIELENAKSIAEKANLAKSDFLSCMSHELRTPLSAILGFAQLMETGNPTPIQKRSLDQILQAGWYLLDLINEILDLALIESGKLSLSMEPVSLSDVMRECQTMIEPQARKRNIHLNFPTLDVNYCIFADRVRLKQVLINLLSNAIKYNRYGGSVLLSCDEFSSDQLRISVKDTGEGLTPEQVSQLFQPFNRLGQESNVEEGTGIGLVMTKRLTELMGGSIDLQSKVGEGTVFWIDMHLTTEQLVLTTPYKTAEPKQNQTNEQVYTLLYVEDNPANLMLIEDLIARRPNIYLLTARDGISGVALALSSIPDLILMDINLPGISGIEALHLLTKDPLTCHIPVVALSANAIPRDIEKGLKAGFFRYLTKPIKVDEFMQTLDVALEYAVKTKPKENHDV